MKAILQLSLLSAVCFVASIIGLVNYFEPTNFRSYVYFVVPLLSGFFFFVLLVPHWTDYLKCKSLAERGDASAMYELSQLLGGFNRVAAIAWAERSASHGYHAADFLAGTLRYRSGLRNAHTFSYFLRAAERGEEAAMRAAADCYKHGHGVLPSDRLAFEWRFKSAISDGNSRHQDRELFGEEKPKDWVPGYLLSRYAVGMCYVKGVGCEKNLVEGYAWLQLAAHAGLIVARQRMKLLDGFDSHHFRLRVQDRSLVLHEALERGQKIEPVSPCDIGSRSPIGALQQGSDMEHRLSEAAVEQPVSAWRAFLSVFLVGNLAAGLLTLISKSAQHTPIRPEVYGMLFGSFFVSAIVGAIYGRRLHAAVNFLLLAVCNALVSAALAYWHSSAIIGSAIGVALAGSAIVLPVAIPLIHWRHKFADFVFYALIALHLLAVVTVLIR